ncbi:hypothetical protein ERJ75_000429500 [Trypanosoma vivax]|nr:hypothetical protein ERJ75_000429500 [Trypanosoma vivax]
MWRLTIGYFSFLQLQLLTLRRIPFRVLCHRVRKDVPTAQASGTEEMFWANVGATKDHGVTQAHMGNASAPQPDPRGEVASSVIAGNKAQQAPSERTAVVPAPPASSSLVATLPTIKKQMAEVLESLRRAQRQRDDLLLQDSAECDLSRSIDELDRLAADLEGEFNRLRHKQATLLGRRLPAASAHGVISTASNSLSSHINNGPAGAMPVSFPRPPPLTTSVGADSVAFLREENGESPQRTVFPVATVTDVHNVDTFGRSKHVPQSMMVGAF